MKDGKRFPEFGEGFGDDWFDSLERDFGRDRKQRQREQYKEQYKQQNEKVHPAGSGSSKQKSYSWRAATTISKVDNDTLFGLFATDTAQEVIELITKKHNDYGAGGIMDAPYGPIKGLITRLHDKVQRAGNISSKPSMVDETLRETFIDIAGYAIIGLMVIDRKFPNS